MNEAVAEEKEKKVEALRVTSLDVVQAAVDEPVSVKIPHGGKLFEVLARRLRPDEESALTLILAEARPPQKQVADERGGTRMELDYSDPDYLKKSRELNIVVRAMALFWCVDIFRTAKDAPQIAGKADDREKIVEFIQKKLTDRLLEALYQAARGDVEGLREGDSLEERVAFI